MTDSTNPNVIATGAVGRKFGVADGLVLVAATAVGLAVSRAIASDDMTSRMIWNNLFTPPQADWLSLFEEFGTVLFVPCLAAWTLACLLLRLRKPRPQRRRLVRRPGMIACLLASVVIGFFAAGLAIWLLAGRNNHESAPYLILCLVSLLCGTAVVWSWSTMVLLGVWRPEPTWLDRLGRLLGASWIVISIICGYSLIR